MISKELLSEIISEDIKSLRIDGNYIDYQCTSEEGHDDTINIYELAHKCKEWANHHFTLLSAVSFDRDNKPYCMVIGDIEEELFEASTEPEAIFKACQWILDNKDNS